jgi:pimeloyl-ACP methyl ester carboxylesterase
MPARRAKLPARVEEWGRRGHAEDFRGKQIHCFHQAGEGPLLLLLHGFPTCSYDWRALIELEPGRALLAFDFLGFGLSDKPRDHDYTLAWQADLAEELVRRHGGGPVYVIAHDMGTSVATELFARDIEGKLGIDVVGALLFDGSVIIERASLTPGQKLLRSRFGPVLAQLSSGAFFRQQLGSVFADNHPIGAEEASDQWALMKHKGGNRIAHKLIGYTFERARHAERWHGAVRDWPKPLSFTWGLEDPVATTHVLDGLRELRPSAPVHELPDLAHYPQIEDPAAFQTALSRALPSR